MEAIFVIIEKSIIKDDQIEKNTNIKYENLLTIIL
jgi:hypothetical protein